MNSFIAGKIYMAALLNYWAEIDVYELRELVEDETAIIPSTEEEAHHTWRAIYEACQKYR